MLPDEQDVPGHADREPNGHRSGSGSPRAAPPPASCIARPDPPQGRRRAAVRPGPMPIATALEVSTSTVERVRKRFVEQGLEAALRRRPPGASTDGSWTASRRPTWSRWPARRHPSGGDAGPCGCWPTSWSSCGTSTASRTRRSARCSRRTASSPGSPSAGASRPSRAASSSGGWRTSWRSTPAPTTRAGRWSAWTRPASSSSAMPAHRAWPSRASRRGTTTSTSATGRPTCSWSPSRSEAGGTSTVTERRTKADWARVIKDLVDVRYPDAERIVLVHGQPEHPHARPRSTRRSRRPRRGGSWSAWRSTTRRSTGAG